MQLYYDIRDIGSKLYEGELAKNLVNSELGINTTINDRQTITDQLYDIINLLTDELDELRHYAFNELKSSLFGIPFKHSIKI